MAAPPTSTWRAFRLLYGPTGGLMVVAFLISSVWTLALAVVQLAPTQVANYLMDTVQLDFGDFWILVRADSAIAGAAAAALGLFSLGYFGLVLLMVHESRNLARPSIQVRPSSVASRLTNPLPTKSGPTVKLVHQDTWQRLRRMDMPSGLHHSPMLTLPKLVLQTTTLTRYLSDGFPLTIIFTYSTLLLLNWIITGYCSITRQADPRRLLVRIFHSFDLFFAVYAPLQVLLYACTHFDFNRDEFATRTETFSTASFDRTARLFADATTVSRFRLAFYSLQLSTLSSLAIKCLLNVLTILRWHRTIRLLGHHGHDRDKLDGVPSEHAKREHIPTRRRCWRAHDWILGVASLGLGAGICISSVVSVLSTTRLCEPFVQCKVPSYQWNSGTGGQCSCLVFVDRQPRVTTFAEWENPVDATASLATLAATGHLKIVQIVNRQLTTLPEELRRCTNLEQLLLLYTKTTELPDWTGEFTQLEYMHIEGDLMAKRLTHLPDDLFQHMPRLVFLHLGTLVQVPRIPDLSRLHNLKYLMLAMLHSITEIPRLESLANLEQLSIIDGIQVHTLPPTHTLTKLQVFALSYRTPVCCNGFVTGTCDLAAFACLDRTALGEPLVACTRQRMEPTEFRRLSATQGLKCDQNLTFDLKDVRPTVASVDLACNGTMYKQCTVNGSPGMCFTARMMPISCQPNKAFQSMRRLQIQRGVGEPCDASVESWLGCAS